MVSSLYIHIPFCAAKCDYCTFSSYPGLESLHDRYVRALIAELEILQRSIPTIAPLKTIFWGGGTPSVLSADTLIDLLDHCRNLFGIDADAEISLEANPESIRQSQLEQLVVAGFTRLSIGVQSLSAFELEAVGRLHSPAEAVDAFRLARQAGFSSISMDLMYGLPHQTVESWRYSLEQALQLQPDHLSLYQLTVEPGTVLAESLAAGRLSLPDEDVILAIDEINGRFCKAAGLDIYEISNFACPGHECRHNINYWHNEQYLAAGAGAVSYLAGCRERRISDPTFYIEKVERGQGAIVESEKLGLEQSFRETVIMGLRMTAGVSLPRLQQRFGIDPVEYYGAILEQLLADSLVDLNSGYLRITPAGRLFSNKILAELV